MTDKRYAVKAKYKPSQEELERVQHDFHYHPEESAEQVQRYQLLRNMMRDVAVNMLYMCPPGVERDRAMVKLQSANKQKNYIVVMGADIADAIGQEL